MKGEKICLINESKYSSYHNPGNTASKVLLNNLNNITIIDNISNNFVDFIKKEDFTIVIFLNVPTLKPNIFEISKIQKFTNVGIFFDDSAQYFNNWFRYLTQVIDFALCWEPVDVSLFETYGVPAALLPGLFNTYQEELMNFKDINWNERNLDCIHIGRMDRPGRTSLQKLIQERFKNTEFWGEGTDNGYISNDKYVQKLFNSKIALNNTGCAKYNFVRKSDPIEWGRKQFKGKLFHYFLSKCVVLTQDSPLLEKFFINEQDLLIYKDDNDLISKINLILENHEFSKKIANSGYQKVLSYIDEKKNITNLYDLVERSKLKKMYKNFNRIHTDKYYTRSISAFAGDEIFSSVSNFNIFIKTFKFSIFDFRVLKILVRKIIKKLIYG